MQRTLLVALLFAVVAAASVAIVADAPARPYKPRTITLIVPFTDRGPTDELAQALARARRTAADLCAAHRGENGRPLASRCTYGVVWSVSASANPQGTALDLAVQPLEN